MYSYDHPIGKSGPDGSPAQRWDFEHARIGASLIITTAGVICAWMLSDALTRTVGTLATWATALALVIVALVAFVYKGSSASWLHPLSLPFGTAAVMSLGAPLWVYFTHDSTGLLYDYGHQSDNASTLAVAVSVTTCKALALVLAGYVAGVGVALVLTKQAWPVIGEQQWPIFRRHNMRHGGLVLMTIGAVSQTATAAITRGSAYGANQIQYGLPSVLSPIAATSLMAGLILVNIAASPTMKPMRLKDLLRGREWFVLVLYLLTIALSGGRGQLIAPIVYLAWAYSTQVRVIPLKSILSGLLLALIVGTMISNYRQHRDLRPGSPAAVMQNAMNDVSSSAWLTQQTIIHVPAMTGYMHGSTYLAALEGQLPGPISRVTGAPTRTASAMFRAIIGFSNPNAGFAESFPSEAYLNFGLAGCLGAGLFLGVLMGWAWRKHRETARRPRDVLYPVLLAGLVYGFRSDALTQIKDVFYPMLIVTVLMGWYRVRISNQDSATTKGIRRVTDHGW